MFLFWKDFSSFLLKKTPQKAKSSIAQNEMVVKVCVQYESFRTLTTAYVGVLTSNVLSTRFSLHFTDLKDGEGR